METLDKDAEIPRDWFLGKNTTKICHPNHGTDGRSGWKMSFLHQKRVRFGDMNSAFSGCVGIVFKIGF